MLVRRRYADALRDAQLLPAQHGPDEPAGAAGSHHAQGMPIDLGRIATPCYFLSTKEDHIAPLASTCRGSLRFGGPVRFVLGGSGHGAGVTNPPSSRPSTASGPTPLGCTNPRNG